MVKKDLNTPARRVHPILLPLGDETRRVVSRSARTSFFRFILSPALSRRPLFPTPPPLDHPSNSLRFRNVAPRSRLSRRFLNFLLSCLSFFSSLHNHHQVTLSATPWARTAKLSLAGAAVLGASFGMPRPAAAQSSSDFGPRVGCAAAGAVSTAAVYAIAKKISPPAEPTITNPTAITAAMLEMLPNSPPPAPAEEEEVVAEEVAEEAIPPVPLDEPIPVAVPVPLWRIAAPIAVPAAALSAATAAAAAWQVARVKNRAALEKAEKALETQLATEAELRGLLEESDKRLKSSEAARKSEERLNHAEELKLAREEFDAYKQTAHWEEAELRHQLEETEKRLEDTLTNLLDSESSLMNAKAQVEATETSLKDAEERMEEMKASSEAKIEEVTSALEARLQENEAEREKAMEELRAEYEKREKDAISEVEEARAELEKTREDLEKTREDLEESEAILADRNGDHSKLRADLDARLAELEAAEAAVDAVRLEMDEALADASSSSEEMRAALEAEHASKVEELERNMKNLEETMSRQMAVSAAEAEAMLRHRRTMGRAAGRAPIEMPVQFELRGIPDVPWGWRVAVTGTWNNWDVTKAIPMERIEDGDEGRAVWAAFQHIKSDDTYEYKYVLVRENSDLSYEENVQWQNGNNRTLALQFSLARHVVLVEMTDTWMPNPKTAPILLHNFDGTIEEVGSTQLLRDCIRELRTEQALLDGGGARRADDVGADVALVEDTLSEVEIDEEGNLLVTATEGDFANNVVVSCPATIPTKRAVEAAARIRAAKLAEKEVVKATTTDEVEDVVEAHALEEVQGVVVDDAEVTAHLEDVAEMVELVEGMVEEMESKMEHEMQQEADEEQAVPNPR